MNSLGTPIGLVATPHNPEARIIPADGLVAEATLRHVVVDRQPAVLGVAAQRLPLIPRIGQSLAQRRFRQRLVRKPIEVPSKPFQDRHRFLRTQGLSRLNGQPSDAILHVV